ncbi:MAG: replication initiation protein [Campylobacteraceae bacterium]|jgi:plasmid replication initiation protein|nr:replication initiation protein [Campylobacteraceae bacterium]
MKNEVAISDTNPNSLFTSKDDKKFVLQHNDLINARYYLTYAEQKFILETISSIKHEENNFEIYEISAQKLREKGIVTNSSTTALKDFAKKAMSRTLDIRIDKNSFILLNWFQTIKYKDGIFRVRFNEELAPYLLQLSGNYTKFQIGYIRGMNSQYSIRIYTLLKKCFGTRITRKFIVEDLMNTLKVPESLHGYAQFKQKVLDIAVREIRAFTDIETFYVTTKQDKKKVIEIEFTIKKNEFNTTDWNVYIGRNIALIVKKELILTEIEQINTNKGYINILCSNQRTELYQEVSDFFDALTAAEILQEKDEQRQKILLDTIEKNNSSSIFKALIAFEKAHHKKIKSKQNPYLSLF